MIDTASSDPADAMAAYVRAQLFPAAFALLPERMRTPAAEAMLLTIALQESGFAYRHQVGGPAHSFWQFEKRGGVQGVIAHPKTSLWISLACGALCYPATVEACYPAIEHNDVLAICFARLLLWTVPDSLPSRVETDRAWQQYLDGWRPGKPHRATWDGYYARAWSLVEP